MKPVFVDTFYFLALVSPADHAHDAAVRVSDPLQWPLLTTAWVLTELGDALCSAPRRQLFLRTLGQVEHDPHVTVLSATRRLFVSGLRLYRARPDKDWSLTDCISFAVMRDRGIIAALTGDRHFEQAGFQALLR